MTSLATQCVSLVCLALAGAAAADEYQLAAAGPPPESLAEEIRSLLVEDGFRIAGADDAHCDIWLVKSPPVKEDFKADLRVKYPFEIGTLIGVLRIGDHGEFTDFRDQVLLPGVYTLRYGQQPQDGNHIGTSQQADFLLAIPAKEDPSAARLADKDELNTLSAEAAGSSHPAIFPLLPPDDVKIAQTRLVQQAEGDLWVLQTAGEAARPPLRLVVVGIGEE